MRRRTDKLFVAAFLVSMATSFLLVAVALQQRRSTIDQSNHSICVQIERLKTQVRQTVERQVTGIGRIDYYRHHPAERAAALRSAHNTLRIFGPVQCP